MTIATDADRIAELEEDNKRLRWLLEQRDAPGELRHRLRNTLALLRAVIRRSADTERDLSDYAAHLEDRLDTIARAQALADRFGEVNLRTLLAEELFQYGASEGEQLLMSGPDVWLRPRAGQVIALAAHELAVNALEHGTLGTSAGRVEVSWSVVATEADTPLLLTWKESNPLPGIQPTHRGFGTEVLTRMLPYDFKAETSLTFEPEGLCCTICIPLPEWVGRVAKS